MNYIVTLTHTRNYEIEADSESEAISKAYNMARNNPVVYWDDVEVEEIDEEETED